MTGRLQPIAPALETTTRELEGAVLLAIRGELDLATAPELCREIELASAESPRIVVDLRGVTLCDTSSLRALIGAAQEAAIRASQIALVVEPQTTLARLVDVSGAREILPVKSALRSALAAFS